MHLGERGDTSWLEARTQPVIDARHPSSREAGELTPHGWRSQSRASFGWD
jgi:hypothetical protein